MRNRLPLYGALLALTTLLSAVPRAAMAGPQDAKPFEDVKPDSPAYSLAADLHDRGVIVGYADGHFDGQRTLTRYEFAVALKRALDAIPANGGPARSTGVGAPPLLDRTSVDELQRLALIFREDLIALGVDARVVFAKLQRLSNALPPARPVRTVAPAGGPSAPDSRSPQHESAALAGSRLLPASPSLFGGAAAGIGRDGFGLRTRIGRATATLFGGAVGAGSQATPFLGGATATSYGGSALQLAPVPGPRYGGVGAATPAFLNFGAAPGRLFGIQGDVPLSRNSAIGLTYLDYSNADRTDPAGSVSALVAGPYSDLTLYGASVKLNPSGRFALTGEASKSVFSRRFADDGDTDDNNAYLLNLKYNGGSVTGAAGYQYYDPGFAAPGYVGNRGSWYNPANLQGPFARVGGNIDRLRADVGLDYLTAAKNRPGFGGFTQGSSLIRGQAGVGYRISKQFELTASYEGILYDMSGAISASGMRAKPVEQYITLGAGLNLSGSTVLKLAYQIVNVQDPDNGFGLPSAFGGGASSSANTAVVTTQFSVHF